MRNFRNYVHETQYEADKPHRYFSLAVQESVRYFVSVAMVMLFDSVDSFTTRNQVSSSRRNYISSLGWFVYCKLVVLHFEMMLIA
jgi:hypothetical protein